jgi:hypothetical protein
MQSWLAKKIVTRNMARVRAGDYRPQLRLAAKDVRFRFPGSSSWATELEGKDELERWLQRFVRVGLQIFPDEVVAKGPPWRTRLMVRGTIHLETRAGKRVYEKRYVIWGPDVLGPPARVRGLRRHREEHRARRVSGFDRRARPDDNTRGRQRGVTSRGAHERRVEGPHPQAPRRCSAGRSNPESPCRRPISRWRPSVTFSRREASSI